MIAISGGLFEYIHDESVEDLWRNRKQLYKAVGVCYIHGYEDAANEIAQFYKAIDKAYSPYRDEKPSDGIEAWWSELRWVVKALSWWKCGDTAEHRFREAWSGYKEAFGANDGGDVDE